MDAPTTTHLKEATMILHNFKGTHVLMVPNLLVIVIANGPEIWMIGRVQQVICFFMGEVTFAWRSKK